MNNYLTEKDLESKYLNYFKISIIFMIFMYILLKVGLLEKITFPISNLISFIGIISMFIPAIIVSIANKKMPNNKKFRKILIIYIIIIVILLIIGQTLWFKSILEFIKSMFKSLE